MTAWICGLCGGVDGPCCGSPPGGSRHVLASLSNRSCRPSLYAVAVYCRKQEVVREHIGCICDWGWSVCSSAVDQNQRSRSVFDTFSPLSVHFLPVWERSTNQLSSFCFVFYLVILHVFALRCYLLSDSCRGETSRLCLNVFVKC